MIRTLRRVFFLSQLLFLSELGQAQQLRPLAPAKTDLGNLQKIATDQSKNYSLKRDKALQLAKKHQWVVDQTLPNGSYISLQGLAENGRPIYYETLFNLTSAITTNTNKVWQGGTSGLNLSGANPLLAGKLGIWDGGAVRKTHQELVGRIVQRDGATALNDHATHVAGTMIARGVSANIKGMAYGALDLQAWNFNNDNSEIAAAASGLLVSNHSYGNVAGWRLIGSNWYWYGDITVNEKDDVNFGYYSSTSQLWDNIAFNAPYYLMVKAAGNSRNMAEPQVGQPYYRYNPAIGNYELMPGRTADMRFYNGYDVIPDHSVAKNILTVGAIQGIPNGYKQPSDAVPYIASSWGPTDDGRIKPDLVGNGVIVTSTMAASDNNYNYASGTSMAAPNITGSLFLLQEHFANRNNGRFMLAATLKGLAIHTANEAGSAPGPDYIYGWGVLNTEGAAKVISNSQQKYALTERTLIQGQTYTQSVIAAGGTEPLRVTISWTDPAGTVLPMIPSTLNNRTPRLVNDLDVRVSNSQGIAQPWILDPNNPSAPATTGDNIRDNVEQVLIANPIPGETYTVTVSHKGTLKNSAQNYSLIMSGLQGIPYCVSKPASATGARIENVTIGSINNTTATCGTYADYTSLVANAEVGQVMPLTVQIGTCDAAANTILKVFADWNEDGDFTDNGELVATSGILTTSSTYATTIAVPTTVQSGNSARLRLVLVETDIAETVSSCGTYAKGETEDYILNFTTPINDIGISALSIPTASTLYANSDQGVTVRIKNFGLASQTNIPVSVNITQGTQQIATLTGTYTGTIGSNQEKTFTMPGSFPVVAGATYTITATTSLAVDPIEPNNQYQATITAQTVAQAPVIAAASCDANASVTLTGSGNGTLYWYDALVGGNLIATGNNTTTSFKSPNNTYYAALNEFTGTTAALNNASTGTFASSTQDTIYFDATVPFVLDRVTMNAQTAGTATLNLYNAVNALIGTSEINLITGVNQYAVNLNIPAAGTKYRLLLTSFTGGATANRNETAGTLAFPYAIPNILTITKSSTGSMYFYDWKLKAAGAPSARAKATLNGTITATETNVCANNNSGTITFNGGGNILRWEQSADGLTWTNLAHTQNNYTYTNLNTTTLYRVIFSSGACPEIASEAITVTVNPIPTATITPNGSTKLCAGSSLMLMASPGYEYLWSTGETTQSITVTQPGNYSVEVKNASGCLAKSAVLAVTNCLTTWTGTTDTNWNNTANWSNGVPDADMDVTVPANVTYSPAVSTGTATCKSITIAGSLTINGGTVKVNENFTNNGTFNQTSGTLELTGKGAQKIKGNSFLNLRMGGASTKTLTSDITVTGSLTVTEGVVNTGAYKIILDQAATLSETSSNYVVGKVMATRSFSKTSAKHTFGNMGLTLSTTASPAPTIEVTRVTGNPGNMIRSVKRQFEIHVTSGKSTDLNATMEFTYLPGELNGLIKYNLALYRSTDNGATWTVQPNSVADLADTNYKVTLSGISAFSTWTAADRDPSVVLPVSLVSFKATKQKDDVVITWETATEKNAAGMEVEVSTNAKNYRTLGFVAATGINTNTRQQYQFTDLEAGKSGTRYYRLKQLDIDGKFTYYSPKAVTFNQPLAMELSAYPNPSKGAFNLMVQAAEAELMQLDIKNTAGQSVYSSQQQLNKGENTVNINLPGAKPGVYVVLARYNNTLHTLKMVVE